MLNRFLLNIYYYICLNLKANIMNYDDWKLDTPEELENECRYCGEPCKKTYCDKQCERADED